ncbi:hypothetical protein ACPPVT_19790 [Angustibacter sp. McL0619]|uniref:hypothetical protein n=1 Tax=Angustibacter sp. McL0619 TaxID=3415676 RepID=UPI003CF6D2AF
MSAMSACPTAAAATIRSATPDAPTATATLPNARASAHRLAQQQTKLMLKFYEGQNVSPSRCGQGQGAAGVAGVFLLPVLSFTPGDRTLTCRTIARSVLVDLGGFVITQDNRFPDSSYPLGGVLVPFTAENLEPICDDVIAQGFLGDPVPATLDGYRTLTASALNSGLFTARVNRHAQIPGGADLYADSVAVGHPGQLATVYCGYKTQVFLRPGQHQIVVDYSGLFGGTSTVFTYNITVHAPHHS